MSGSAAIASPIADHVDDHEHHHPDAIDEMPVDRQNLSAVSVFVWTRENEEPDEGQGDEAT